MLCRKPTPRQWPVLMRVISRPCMLGRMGKDLQPPSPRAPHLIVRVGERHYGPLAGGQWLSLVMLACAVGLALYGLKRGGRVTAA